MIKAFYNKDHFIKATFAVIVCVILSVAFILRLIESDLDLATYIGTIFATIVYLDLSTREYRFDGILLSRVHAIGKLYISLKSIPAKDIISVHYGQHKFYGLIHEEAIIIEYNGSALTVSSDYENSEKLYNALVSVVERRNASHLPVGSTLS